MTKTILPKKASQENPLATNDEHHELLKSDPLIPQFPQVDNSIGVMPASPVNTLPSSPVPVTTTITNKQTETAMQPATQPVLTAPASSNAASGADVLVKNDNTDWINKKWRPAMGWVYMVTCTADFVLFPILWSLLQVLSAGSVTTQWQPLTLQGAGLYHIAMGAVLGIAAYGRTKEKIEGASN